MKTLLLVPAAALLMSAVGPEPRRPRLPHHGALLDQVGTPAFEPLLRLNGMSEAGIKALRAVKPVAGDDESMEIAQCGVIRAAAASPIDVPALDRAIAARDSLAAARAARTRDALIADLARLDAGDATVLLKLVGTGNVGGDMGGPGGPPPPGAHEGPPPGPPPVARCEV